MKAWKLQAPKQLVLEESAPSVLKENFVKIKVEKVLLGTCDLEYYNGTVKQNYPFVLGRSAVGVVSEVFDKEKSIMQKLDRVVIEPFITCNTCKECASQEYHKCENLKYMGQNCDGLMQNFVDVHIDQVHHMPDNMTFEQGLFVPHVAFGLNIVDALNLEKGNHVTIFASTKMGIILAQLMAYYQAVPILVSPNEDLLNAARDMGIFYCVNNKEVDVEREVLTITGGRMCSDLVLFSDSEFSFNDVYNSASINANICLAGISNKDSSLSLAQICQKHLNIFGVYNGVGNFSSAINLLVTGTIKIDRLIGEKVPFAELDKAIEEMKISDAALKANVINID